MCKYILCMFVCRAIVYFSLYMYQSATRLIKYDTVPGYYSRLNFTAAAD